MKTSRLVAAGLGTLAGVVAVFLYPTSTNRPAPGQAGAASVASGVVDGTSGSSSSASSGTYTGDVAQTRWGPVQVEITVSGGRVTAAQAVQYPNGNGRDAQINAYAIPILDQEAVSAQSAKIDAVSGATVTSDGYVSSLQSAVDQAFRA